MTTEEWKMVTEVLCRCTEDGEYCALLQAHEPLFKAFDDLWGSFPEPQQNIVYEYLFSQSKIIHRAIAIACRLEKK